MSEDAWHVILVPAKGRVLCSCTGDTGWCSHIDATLMAGERAMVPPAEWAEANRAQIAARGRISPPPDWQAHWRNNRSWRGLPPARITMLERSRQEGRPIMSIEGRGGGRELIKRISIEAGWMITGQPVTGCLFHIAPSEESNSRAAERARSSGIPIATYDEWAELAGPLGKMLSHEISTRKVTAFESC